MPESNQYPALITNDLTATIAISASLSGSVDVNGTTIAGYIMPAAWTAAGITLQVSVDGTNFFNLYDQYGNEVSHIVDASSFVQLTPSDMAAIRYIKIRSGTSGTPVNQAAERVITLVTRRI